MRSPAALLLLLLGVVVFIHSADATCAAPDPLQFTALNGATIPSDCANVGSGFECKPICKAGYTSYPDPVLVCGTQDTWSLRDEIGCYEVCPGDPPATNLVLWTTVNDPAGGGVPSPTVPCTDRIPVYNVSTATVVQCDGSCVAAFGTPFAICERNASTNALQWAVTGACNSGVCNSVPPKFNNGTNWPLSCHGTAVGSNCTASCSSQTTNFWGTGNDTDQFPTINCVEDSMQPAGGRWDTSNITGNCVPVCALPERIWIRNGSWPEWCETDRDPITGAFTGRGGLTANQVCKGVCLPGYFGSPQWVCSPKGKFKSNRTGDCFPGERGGCWGPVTAPIPLNSMAWDRKCWDMRVGWNCSTDCKGEWNVTISDPAAVGYGTAEQPYLPHVNCVYNASEFYNGSYTPAVGKCVQVCRGPLPLLANGRLPDSCRPVNGGIGGIRTNNSRCVATCNVGSSPANGVTPYVTCSGGGWGPLISACNVDGVPPPNICAGGVPAPNVAHAQPWAAACANQPPGFLCSTQCVDDPNAAVTGSNWGTATPTTPFVRCNTNLTWDPRATGACNRVCAAEPTAVSGVSWDPECIRAPGGIGGVRSGGVCKGTCTGANVGIPRVSCVTAPVTGVMGWSTPSITCVSNTQYQGACEGVPNPGPVTNVAGPQNWPCQDLWVGQNCTAICNFGGSPNVTYASGSPTLPPPTVTCAYNASALPYLGQYSRVITGRCISVCRNGPPAVTGITWPVMCTPQASGRGGISTGAGTCNGTCAAGYSQTNNRPPSTQCMGGTWGTVANPCVLNTRRRLRTEGML